MTPLERGLLITHIDDSLAFVSGYNSGIPSDPHYRVSVEDAGYNAARDYTTNLGGQVSDSAQWWYPFETRKGAPFTSEVPGKQEFSPTTTPSSDGYKAPTGVVVRVDSIVGDKMYIYVNNPLLAATNSDGDSLANFLDNCPLANNNDQLDSDGDGLGDYDEINTYFTDPNNADSDGDLLDDGIEVTNGSDPNDPNSWPNFADGDLAPLGNPDGLINAADYIIGQRIVLQQITPTALEFAHGDLHPPGSPDGDIDTSDLILLQQLILPP